MAQRIKQMRMKIWALEGVLVNGVWIYDVITMGDPDWLW